MVSPRDAMETVAKEVAHSGKLPQDMSLVLREPDLSLQDADVDMPVLEMRQTQVNDVSVNNSDLVGYVNDSNGNRTGRIYESEYEMTITINLWTSADGQYDPDDLGERLREALYPYSSYGPDRPFTTGDGDPITEITYFDISSGTRDDDILRTPTVRRWSQEVELWGCERFQTDEDYIVDVSYPASGDLNDTDGDGTIDDK